MKKIIIAATLVFSTQAMARHYGAAGCGLGSLAFGSDGSQIMAATTNGTSNSQMFGITSGTSNCVDTAGHAKLKTFIEGNRLALESDVSRAQGETLQSVAYYFGCANNESFRSTLQQNFESIFQEASSEAVFEGLKQSLNSQSAVAVQCSELG